MKPFISVCMIVKNEAEMLPRALGNLDGVWDELLIVDTGSTDETEAIAHNFGATVLHYDWQYPGHKGEARNVGLDAATGEWVVVLDADEIIEKPADLRAWLETLGDEITAVNVQFQNYAEDGSVSLTWYQPRVWRNGKYRYKHREHELPMATNGADIPEIGATFIFEHRPPLDRAAPKVTPMLDRLIADVDEWPDDAHALYFLHRQWLHAEEWQNTIDVGLRFLEAAGPENNLVDCYGYMATAHYMLGDYRTSMEWLHKALCREPQRKYWWVRIGEMYASVREWNSALAFLRGGAEVWQQHSWQKEPEIEVRRWQELVDVCQSAISSSMHTHEG